ncbi:hypothetical protein PVAND_001236 [Polypedilum vanderplanki]|uniref:RRM domain-containing protein n=1 Tax=Polypedilum vanderplanki TaxID=319348 RepID=A0A9J6BMS0_POLVA|nr:hypothetical protein PVAND_001236 [Polypedilum vanderplanki]
MKSIKIFLFLLSVSQIKCEIEFIEHGMCDVVREKIILELFKEKQTIVTLVSTEIGSRLDFNCMSSLPLMHFTSLKHVPESQIKEKSIMMDFDTTRGLIYHGSSEKLLNEVFPKIASFNPKIRFLIIITDEEFEELLIKIFTDAWEKFRIFDIFIIYDEEFKDFFQLFNIYGFYLFRPKPQLIQIEVPFLFGDGLERLENFKQTRFNKLEGYELKVVLFTFIMVCEGQVDENGNFILETLRLQDSEILKILSKFADFKIKFVKSPDGINHGYQASNNTFTGSLGMVEYERADFAANARLVAEYNTSNSLCLFPTTTTKLKFSVPKKYWDEVNILTGIYKFLDDKLKLAILILGLVLPILAYICDYISGVKQNSFFNEVTLYYTKFQAIMSFVSVKLPKNWSSRCIVGSVVLFWLIIGNTYSGKMIEFLNTNSGLKQIESIDELMQSDLIVKIPYPMASLFEGNFENTSRSHQLINKIVTKSREMEKIGDPNAFVDVHNMAEMIRSKKYALLFLDNLIDHVEKFYYNSKGNNIMTHIEETPYEYYYATSVPKTSAFVERFNEIIMKSFEAGISKYQMSEAMIDNDLFYIKRMKEGKVPDNSIKSISFNQVFKIDEIILKENKIKNIVDEIEKGSNLYCLKTEDGVNIRKLFLKIFDTSLKTDEIKYLLSVYGKITDIKINIGCGKMRFKNRGYVVYERNCDATKALLGRKNFKDYFLLCAADTWLQPDYIKPSNLYNIDEKINNNESKLLNILDDDCLLHIMYSLDPLDIFTLKNVCSKFFELSKFYFRTIRDLNFTIMKGKKKMTLLEAKMICEKVGKNVLKLSINSEKFNNPRILNFIPKYFPNLKYLQLIGFKLESKDFWEQMKKILIKLETLDLSDNSFIHENFLKCFKNEKNVKLKSLNLSNSNVSSDFLEHVQFIEHLNISGCRNINGQHLIPYVTANKNLISLNIGKCANIYGKAVNEILLNAQQLRAVTLNNYYVDEDTSRFVIPNINPMVNLKELTIQNLNYPLCDQLLRTINLENKLEILNISYGNLTLTTVYAISTMKNLRKLFMNFKTSVSDDLIDYLVDKEHLEEIHIAACSYLSAENILRLFNIKSLKFLDISRCYGFTNDFIIDVCLKIKETQPREKIFLQIGQTEIDQNILNDEFYLKCKKYLHLSWECAKNLEHDYDIDEENNKAENLNQDCYNLDDIINILSNIDDCDPKIVAAIRENL